jgi:hypothetical protein
MLINKVPDIFLQTNPRLSRTYSEAGKAKLWPILNPILENSRGSQRRFLIG